MSGFEMQLICKVIKEGTYKEAVEAGLSEEILQSTEAISMLRQIQAAHDSVQTRGSIIGPRAAAHLFPMLNLESVDTHMTTQHLVELVRRAKASFVVEDNAARALEIARVDPYKGAEFLQAGTTGVMRLDGGRNTDINFGAAMVRLKERYAFIKGGGSLGRYPWPWAVLQNETGGVQQDEFMVLYGRPKSMKSFVLTFLIAEAMRHGGQRVLVYTKEMTPDDIFMRIVAFLAYLPYHSLRHAKLTPDEEDRLVAISEWAEDLKEQGLLTILSAKDVPPGRDTPAWLGSKIEKYGATVACIDGLYLLSPPSQKPLKDNERVALISREIRQLGLGLRVPILGTMQATRSAAKHNEGNLDEIAFSDALAQDCTLAVRTIRDKDGTISLVIGGSREFQLNGFRINGVPGVDFGYHSLLSANDVIKAKSTDKAEEEPGMKKLKVRERKVEDKEIDAVLRQ